MTQQTKINVDLTPQNISVIKQGLGVLNATIKNVDEVLVVAEAVQALNMAIAEVNRAADVATAKKIVAENTEAEEEEGE